MLLAASALPIGILSGLLLAFAKNSKEVTYRLFANAVTTILRALPELLTILLIYILGQRMLNHTFGIARVEISAFWTGVVALSLVFAAYSSEVFLGSLRAIDATLNEAAGALGLGFWTTLRFITMPELFRLSGPGLLVLWLSLLKQTSLMSVLGYSELLSATYRAASSTGEHIAFYVLVCVLYAGLCEISVKAWFLVKTLYSRNRP